MLAVQRSQKILEILHENKSVQVSDLVKLFNVSDVTIRKDLKKLQEDGIVTKTHGGAVLKKAISLAKKAEKPKNCDYSMDQNSKKDDLARYICRYIKNGDTIFLGSGYGCLALARQLPDDLNISVITHNIEAVQHLKDKCRTVILLGGEVVDYDGSLFTYSSEIQEELKVYNINKAITSCSGVDLDFGISFSTEASKKVITEVLKNSQSWYLMADSSKFNNLSPYKVADIHTPEMIVTELLTDKYQAVKNIEEC